MIRRIRDQLGGSFDPSTRASSPATSIRRRS